MVKIAGVTSGSPESGRKPRELGENRKIEIDEGVVEVTPDNAASIEAAIEEGTFALDMQDFAADQSKEAVKGNIDDMALEDWAVSLAMIPSSYIAKANLRPSVVREIERTLTNILSRSEDEEISELRQGLTPERILVALNELAQLPGSELGEEQESLARTELEQDTAVEKMSDEEMLRNMVSEAMGEGEPQANMDASILEERPEEFLAAAQENKELFDEFIAQAADLGFAELQMDHATYKSLLAQKRTLEQDIPRKEQSGWFSRLFNIGSAKGLASDRQSLEQINGQLGALERMASEYLTQDSATEQEEQVAVSGGSSARARQRQRGQSQGTGIKGISK